MNESVLFVGTGTSGCVPAIGCLLNRQKIGCAVCPHAQREFLAGRPCFNHRLNTSIVYSSSPTTAGADESSLGVGESAAVNLLVDCGKTFLWQSLQIFPPAEMRGINAILLTHPHADAVLGLDDLRGWTMNSAIQSSIRVYCDADTFAYVKSCFPYLVDTSRASGGGDVPALVFHVLETVESESSVDGDGLLFKPVDIDGVLVQPFRVQHGWCRGREPFYSLGFIFNGSVVYISDCSHIPPKSMELLQSRTQSNPWNMIIVDALHSKAHPSHFSFRQSLEFLFGLNARAGFLSGMTHAVDHFHAQRAIDDIVRAHRDRQLTELDFEPLFRERGRPVVEFKEEYMEWDDLDRFFVKLAWDGLMIDVASFNKRRSVKWE